MFESQFFVRASPEALRASVQTREQDVTLFCDIQ